MKNKVKNTIFVLITLIAIFAIYRYVQNKNVRNLPKAVPSNVDNEISSKISSTTTPTIDQNIPQVSVVAEGLDTPWAIAFLPDGSMLVTERKGTLRLVTNDFLLQEKPVINLTNVKEIGEGGLLGITLHPDFSNNHFVYLYYTYKGDENKSLNRVSRFTYENNVLMNEEVIIDNIAAASNHDGGRIKFGPDKYLYVTIGDAENPSNAQNKDSLSGKILRVTDNGDPVSGNPFGNLVYSYGHRNPQGIVWDKNGQLWETEHGPSGTQTGNDEFNKIKVGKNYGWPIIKGDQTRDGMITPVLESGFHNTWAPGDLAYLNDKFYFVGLRGSALYEVEFVDGNLKLNTYLKNEFGRLREVIVGPDQMLYITTSNRDGRGVPKPGDDKILRINPNKL